MPRIVVGHYGGTFALSQVRGVLAELNETWSDISIVQRTVQARGGRGASELLDALSAGHINMAVQCLGTLPVTLPEGLALTAVGRRLEARTALVVRDRLTLQNLPQSARVGVQNTHNAAFLYALRPEVRAEQLEVAPEDLLLMVQHGDLHAAILAAADLISAGQRERVSALLEPRLMPPPAGQGGVGFVVREDDDLAAELAYTLQHRPSFDRARAERAFVTALAAPANAEVGAFASISGDGKLELLGAVAEAHGKVAIQAEVAGEASGAEALGRALAGNLLERLTARS